MGRRQLTVKPAEEFDEFGELVEVEVGAIGLEGFLEENVREASGGDLKADFGQFGGIVAAKEIQELILVEAVLEDMFLGVLPFEVTAGSPIGDVAVIDGVASLVEGGDDVFVGDRIPEHAVDHVALEFGEAGDAAVAAHCTGLGEGGDWFGVNDGDGWGAEGWSGGRME